MQCYYPIRFRHFVIRWQVQRILLVGNLSHSFLFAREVYHTIPFHTITFFPKNQQPSIIVMGSQHSKSPQPGGTTVAPEAPIVVDGDNNPDESSTSSSFGSTPLLLQFVPCHDDWPYVWAIRDVLDWRKACPTPEMVQDRVLEQLQLPVDITPLVYLGDAACVSDNNGRLQALGITGVLNVAAQNHKRATLQALEEAGIAYQHIPTQDVVDYPLLAMHWEEIFQALQSLTSTKNSRVVVHCHAGQNRAGLVVAAYTMLTQRLSVLETVRLVRYQRGNTALVNHGFQEQLVALARTLDLLGPAPGTPGSIVRQRAPPVPTSSNGSVSAEKPWWIVQKPADDEEWNSKGKRKMKAWRQLGKFMGASRRWNNFEHLFVLVFVWGYIDSNDLASSAFESL